MPAAQVKGRSASANGPLGFGVQNDRVSSRAFNWSLVAIGTLILLSIPEGTGALIGVFFGFGLAFFVAAPGWALSATLQHNGMTVGFKELMVGLAALYGLMVLGLALSGWIAFRRGRPERGRLWTAKAALFAALPLIAYFSLNAMQAAWP